MSIFRIEDNDNEMIRKMQRKAEEEVFKEILDGMVDAKGKVPKYKGGRWEKIEGKKPLKVTKDMEMDADEYEQT